jgi:hypothetical protein
MFHWICPECGREIAPTVRECPACDPKAVVAEPALVGVVEAPARALNVEAPARTQNVEAPPRALPVAMRPRAVSGAPARFRSPEVMPVEASAPVAPDEPDGLPQLMPSPFAGNSSLGGFAMVIGLLDDITPDPPMAAKVAVSLRAAPAALKASSAELTPAPEAPHQALPLPRSPGTTPERQPSLVETRAELRMADARPPAASAHHARVTALAPSRASLAAPRGTPHAGPAPALAPLAVYSPLAGRPLRPAAPRSARLKPDSTRRVTLPGPMLTPSLVSFKDRELGPIFKESRSKDFTIPAGFIRWMIVAVMVLLAVRAVSSFLPQKPADASTAAASTASTAPVSAPLPAVSTPLSKAIEVTGIRIVADPARKSEIQYLVVNHTPARFSGVTVYVTVRAADAKPGQPPLCRFSFAAPSLGPFQSKEMISSVERMNRPEALPEWQDLRADIEIGQ